jgi:hypothetical protein
MPNPTDSVRIRQTDLNVTRLSIGSAPIGNLLSEVSEEDVQGAFKAAFEAGVRSAAKFEENQRLFRHPIPDDMWQELKAEGLLAEEVPLPSNEEKTQ